jgi:Mg-chelatase subunit ChlD
MLGLYDIIAADLRGDSAYLLKAAAPSGVGGIKVVETGEPITGVSAPSRVALIFDASGSMRAKTEGGAIRMDAAKAVLHQVVDELPDGTDVALRVYGHRLPREPKGPSCGDTELVVPFGPLDRPLMHAVIDAIQPKGQTPLGYSLAQLYDDFAQAPGQKMAILVTDGIETCDPEPDDEAFPPKIVELLRGLDIELKVNVVGLDIPADESATRELLKTIADRGGGSYYDASGAAELKDALADAFRAEFAVRDSAGQEVARGKVGGPVIDIPDGRWRVVLATDPERDLGEVTVSPPQVVRIEIAKEGDRFAASIQP